MALSARLSDLADRISAVNGGGQPSPRPQIGVEARAWPPLSRDAHEPDRAAIAEPRLPAPAAPQSKFIDHPGLAPRQAQDLRAALDQIDLLTQTIGSLREKSDRSDLEIATVTHRLIVAENENSDLRAALNAERKKSAALSQSLLTAETAFNDRLVDFTANQETAERLADELKAAQAETARVVSNAEAKSLHLFGEGIALLSERYDLRGAELRDRYEQQANDLRSALAEREQQNVRLETACRELEAQIGTLTDNITALESENEQAREAIRTLAGQIAFIEKTAALDRQNAEATLKEMIAEFGRERDQLLARERDAAEIRKNIVQLLPKLVARPEAPAAPLTAQVA